MTNRLSRTRTVAVIGTSLWFVACSAVPGQSVPASPPPTSASWKAAKRTLADIAVQTNRPRTMRIALALREPLSGRTLESRGALAVAPPESLRMIMLGPGGTTSLDLWLHADEFRFAVPAIELLRRGNAKTPRKEMRGLPVDFLHWWLLRPTSGTLLWHTHRDNGSQFVLRDGQAIVDLHLAQSGHITARRTTWEPRPDEPQASRKVDEEIVEADGWGCGVVQYRQTSTNLRVTVTCESEDTQRPPNPRAFVDPDAPASLLLPVWRQGS